MEIAVQVMNVMVSPMIAGICVIQLPPAHIPSSKFTTWVMGERLRMNISPVSFIISMGMKTGENMNMGTMMADAMG